MRTALVSTAMVLVLAAPLSAQNKNRSRDHRQPRQRQVHRTPPRHQPSARRAAPRARRNAPTTRQRDRDREAYRDRNVYGERDRDGYRDRNRDAGRYGGVYRDRDWNRSRDLYRDRDDYRNRSLYRDRDRDERYRLARPYAYGRFRFLGPRYRYPVLRIDIGARRLWLGSGFSFEIAAWDWPYAARWCWNCGQFVVYVDPLHPGWYLLYDLRLGEYVHVRYLGG
jgi:hypothetical protein